ncbi:MAG: hypothetical protein HOP08_01120 [Cyclobacteriaceae bacterium]|nr:hypothetical protein [Cyclobacteriaceae bacterium]
MKPTYLRVSMFMISLTLGACLHEPAPTCEGVELKVELIKTDADPGQTNGTIIVIVDGPAKFFTYSINNSEFQASNKFTGLDSGNYTVTAKNSWGCKSHLAIAIKKVYQDPCVGVVFSTSAIDASLGKSDGSITATLTGGTGYSFSLNNGPFQTSKQFSGLPAGIYTIAAKGSNGCSFTSQATIADVNVCAGLTVAVTATSTSPGLNQSNGQVVASATGGSGFTFSINGGAFQTTGTFNGLAAGNYSITAKNSNGCTGTTQVAIGSTNPCVGVTVMVTGTVTGATVGQSDGSITASAAGGSGFTFNLNNGSYQTNGTFIGLPAGNYTIGAKNSSGCLGSAAFTISSVNPCAAISLTIASTVVASNNCVTPGTGTITATASGSTGFMYNINNGTYQSSGLFASLSPGTYSVGAKDVNGCTSSVSVSVGTVPPGVNFAAVKVLIQTRCSGSGCHTNGQSQKGFNFDTDCKIVNAWSGINGSTITGTLNKMPISPQANLTTAEKQLIINWVNAGHGFSN